MTKRTPPTARIARRLSPFRQQPQRWERKRSRAVRGGHVCCGSGCAAGCEPVLIRERAGWGWIDWTVPADGSLPEQPHRMAVFTPIATRSQRISLRWLARRPAHRVRLGKVTVRPATAVVTALTLVVAALALMHGVPFGIVVPAAALAPLLVEHLPDRLDARAGENARIVEDEAACRYLQRLTALHAGLVRAAVSSDRYEVRRAVEIGHHQLFDAADLLQRHDTRSASSELIARERLMLQLAVQTRQIVTPTQGDAAAARHDRFGGQRPLGPYPPGPRWRSQSSAEHTTPVPPTKEETNMPQEGSEQPTGEVYLLFAHEAYHPAAAQEINTSLVAFAVSVPFTDTSLYVGPVARSLHGAGPEFSRSGCEESPVRWVGRAGEAGCAVFGGRTAGGGTEGAGERGRLREAPAGGDGVDGETAQGRVGQVAAAAGQSGLPDESGNGGVTLLEDAVQVPRRDVVDCCEMGRTEVQVGQMLLDVGADLYEQDLLTGLRRQVAVPVEVVRQRGRYQVDRRALQPEPVPDRVSGFFGGQRAKEVGQQAADTVPARDRYGQQPCDLALG
jgi:hypothetical protein